MSQGTQPPSRFYQRLFHNTSDGHVLHRPDSPEIVDANKRLAEMLGYSREELLGLTVQDITYDDWDPPSSAWEMIQRAREEKQVTFEWREQRKDGTPFWTEVNLTLVELDDEEYVLASIRDIENRKQKQRRRQALLDQSYQLTALLETDGTIIEANERARDFARSSRSSVMGKQLWECYWGMTEQESKQRLKNAVGRAASGESVRFDIEVQGLQTPEVIDFSIRPTTDEQGAVTLLIAEGRPITERVKREQQLSVLSRILRHNVRNTMNVIQANIDLATNRLNGDAAERMQKAESRLVSLEELCTKYHETVKLLNDPPEQQQVQLRRHLRSIIEVTEESYPDAEIRLEGPETVAVTAIPRVIDALSELVENAVVHNDATRPSVVVRINQTENGVTVSITDNGPGIPSEDAKILTGDQSAQQLAHGSGVGLWVIYWTLDLSGASATVDADETGSTVRVEF